MKSFTMRDVYGVRGYLTPSGERDDRAWLGFFDGHQGRTIEAYLSPTQARRLARALLKFADAKKKVAP